MNVICRLTKWVCVVLRPNQCRLISPFPLPEAMRLNRPPVNFRTSAQLALVISSLGGPVSFSGRRCFGCLMFSS